MAPSGVEESTFWMSIDRYMDWLYIFLTHHKVEFRYFSNFVIPLFSRESYIDQVFFIMYAAYFKEGDLLAIVVTIISPRLHYFKQTK